MKGNMKNISLVLSGLYLLTADLCVEAQNFTNLDFEGAKVTGYSPNSENVPVTNALPGWTAYYGSASTGETGAVSEVWYDAISLGSAMISINDTNRGLGFVPFQGKFSASLNGDFPDSPPLHSYFAAIGQTGQLPSDVQSLIIWVSSVSVFQVTFGGLDIPLLQIGSGANYIIAGGDISAYAGQTGELLFTALPDHSGFLDNIQFSTLPIPEPTAFSLFALGGLLIGCRWRKSKR
jgi:hypothetical protein